MKIIEYEEKYLEDVRDLLVELEEYIISIDKDNLDQLHADYREKKAIIDLEEVSSNEGKCYLAIENNKVIGLIMGIISTYDKYAYLDYKCPKRGYISELIVSKNVRSNGAGLLLMNTLEDYFKSKSCEYIIVDVFAYNEIGKNFYHKNNYHNRMYTMLKKITLDNDFTCKVASLEDVCKRWDHLVKVNDEDINWVKWRESSIENFKMNNRIIYYGYLNGEVICEATAVINKNDIAVKDIKDIFDEKTVYLEAFRTDEQYENKGYFSKLYKFMENDLKEKKYEKLVLGVEPCEIKNMQIYFKYGYNNYIKTNEEVYPNKKKVLVNYYSKKI